jgi:predicted KAP-like P-loop ATPase
LVQSIPQKVRQLDKDDASELIEKAASAAKEMGSIMKDAPVEETSSLRRSVREFRDDFANLLHSSSITTLVVFIDELDRCMPDTVLETLQAIRLFLAVPGTAFVIGADERFVEHAVQVKFPLKPEEGRTLNVGRHYLEKIVHHPIRIPPLSQAEMTTYMNLLLTSLHVDKDEFTSLCKELLAEEPIGLDEVRFDLTRASNRFSELDSSVRNELRQDLLLVEQISKVLTTGLDGNPRQTKRFLNMMRLRLRMAEARKVSLEKDVLAKLMLLEYFRLEHFRQLADWQGRQNGQPQELEYLEGFEPTKKQVNDGDMEESSQQQEEAQDQHGGATPTIESDQFITWANDEWLRTWLENEPKLSRKDLRPYFFFARERLSSRAVESDHLSRPAQEVIELLLSPPQANHARGRERARSLSPADAAAVAQSLAGVVRRTENLQGNDSPLMRLLDFVEVRPELLSEVVPLLSSLPASRLPLGLPPRLMRLSSGKPTAAAVRILLTRWKDSSENPRLQQAAKLVLEGSS